MFKNLNLSQLYVLSSLTEQDRYGLEIIKTVMEEASYKIILGSLYNILAKLEREGFVESYWGDATPERGGHRRKYYRITGAGENAVSEARRGLSSIWGGLSTT